METASALVSPLANTAVSPGPAGVGASVTALVRPVEHPLGRLDQLESLAIFIIHEVAAESERPVLLFSGGKDSAVLLHIASKAFRPGRMPFPVLHVDTGHNFSEVLAYRDAQVETEEGARLLVAKVQDSIDQGRVADPRAWSVTQPVKERAHAPRRHQRQPVRRRLQQGSTTTRTRPGPRTTSCRSTTRSGSGIPSASAPSCGSCTRARCGRVSACEPSRCRTGPSSTSGSTSRRRAHRAALHLLHAHEREVVENDGMLLALSEWVTPQQGEESRKEEVGYTTVGDSHMHGRRAVNSQTRSKRSSGR